jgi:hypothetical protein
MGMFTMRTTAALFTIAIASSLLVVSGGGFVGSTLAAAKKVTNENEDNAFKTLSNDKSTSQFQTADAGDSTGSTGDTSGVSAKDLKGLSKCESNAAADGDLTQTEVTDCYHQSF